MELDAIRSRLAKSYVVKSTWQEHTGKAVVEVDFFAALDDVQALMAEIERLAEAEGGAK